MTLSRAGSRACNSAQQDLPDQMVVAVGVSLLIDNGDEHVRTVEVIEQGGRPRAARTQVADRHRQFIGLPRW